MAAWGKAVCSHLVSWTGSCKSCIILYISVSTGKGAHWWEGAGVASLAYLNARLGRREWPTDNYLDVVLKPRTEWLLTLHVLKNIKYLKGI